MVFSKTCLAIFSLLLAGSIASAPNDENSWGGPGGWMHWSKPNGQQWGPWTQEPNQPPNGQSTGLQPASGQPTGGPSGPPFSGHPTGIPSGSGGPGSSFQPTGGPGGPGGPPSGGWGGWSGMPNSQPWSATVTPMPQSSITSSAQASDTSDPPEQSAAATSAQPSDISNYPEESAPATTAQGSNAPETTPMSYSQRSSTPPLTQQSGTVSASQQTGVDTTSQQDSLTTLVMQSTRTTTQSAQETSPSETDSGRVRVSGYKRPPLFYHNTV